MEEFSDNSIFLPVFEISRELARFPGIENLVLPGFSRRAYKSWSVYTAQVVKDDHNPVLQGYDNMCTMKTVFYHSLQLHECPGIWKCFFKLGVVNTCVIFLLIFWTVFFLNIP